MTLLKWLNERDDGRETAGARGRGYMLTVEVDESS